MIALEGGWGSGKTTVVNLLRKYLQNEKNVTVFSFDAWAHEGDPLRRTYLESLIRHFRDLGWIEKEPWDKKLRELAHRRKVSSTRTVPKTTALGKLVAISVLLVPVGVPFLTKGLDRGVALSGGAFNWRFLVGLVLALAPFVILGCNWIRILWKRRVKRRLAVDSSVNPTDDEEEVSEWSFLIGDAITETTQDTIETPEPTSIEFEDRFRELMSAALKGRNRRGVIVLDNLDRVAPKNALTIWSTLQTFLQHRSIAIEQWFKNLWIIVPYDPAGLRQLWRNWGAEGKPKPAGGGDESDGQNQTQIVVSDSFLDKSFQLRFEVPPAVLSNWKQYLRNLVDFALPEHSKDQEVIYQVFDGCRSAGSEAPTPRELKLFVNQIGVIHREWQDDFPLGDVAYYVILRRGHTDVCKALLDGKLPHKKNVESIISANLHANLAGLAFNVEPRVGQQLLLSDPIKDSLMKGDVKSLQELARNHDQGFWAVLDQVFRLTDYGAAGVGTAALCLDESGILEDQERREARTVIQRLAQAAVSISEWTPFNKDLATGISAVCRLVSDSQVSARVVASVRATVERLGSTDNETPAVEEVVAALVDICHQMVQLGHAAALDSTFSIGPDADSWQAACAYLSGQDPELWQYFEPRIGFEPTSQSLVQAVQNGSFSDVHLSVVRVTEASPIGSSWDPLARVFGNRVTAHPPAAEVSLLLRGLGMLRTYGSAEGNVISKRLADAGELMHCLDQAHRQNSVECKAWCVVTFLQQRPEAGKPASVGESESGYNILLGFLNAGDAELGNQIVRVLKGEKELELLLKVVDARNKYDEGVSQCLRIVADEENAEDFYIPSVVIERWSPLKQGLGDEGRSDRFNELLGRLCEKTGITEEVVGTEGGFRHKDAGLYLAICEATSSEGFHEWCRDGLTKLDASAWKSELASSGDALNLMVRLAELGVAPTLGYQYQDALAEHAERLADGQTPPPDVVNHQEIIFSCLGPTDLQRLRTRLLRIALNKDGRIQEPFLAMYGREIAEGPTLAGSNDVVAQLFSPLIREYSVSGLGWLRETLANNKGLLDHHKDVDAVEEFRTRVEEKLNQVTEDEDQRHNLIQEIANTLGIEPAEEASQQDAESESGGSED